MPKSNIPTWQIDLGREIRAVRKKRNYPLGKLANALDVDRETVRLYETGQVAPPLPALRIILRELDAAFTIQGTTVSISTLPPAPEPQQVGEQTSFDFRGEYVGVTVRMSVSKAGFDIIAAYPAKQIK